MRRGRWDRGSVGSAGDVAVDGKATHVLDNQVASLGHVDAGQGSQGKEYEIGVEQHVVGCILVCDVWEERIVSALEFSNSQVFEKNSSIDSDRRGKQKRW